MTTLTRMALEEARDALLASLGPTVGTPVFKTVSLAIASADRALAEEVADEEAEADAQRARDRCIGAFGYDLDRLK